MPIDRENDPLLQTCEKANAIFLTAEQSLFPLAASHTEGTTTVSWGRCHGKWRILFTRGLEPRPISECNIADKFDALQMLPGLQAAIQQQYAALLAQGKEATSLAEKFLADIQQGSRHAP